MRNLFQGVSDFLRISEFLCTYFFSYKLINFLKVGKKLYIYVYEQKFSLWHIKTFLQIHNRKKHVLFDWRINDEKISTKDYSSKSKANLWFIIRYQFKIKVWVTDLDYPQVFEWFFSEYGDFNQNFINIKDNIFNFVSSNLINRFLIFLRGTSL